jgi:enterochelin esterase-like enzyme
MRSAVTSTLLTLALATGVLSPPPTAQGPPPAQGQPGAPASGAGSARGNNSGRGNNNDAFYQLGPDSQSREDVPHGTIDGPFTLSTAVYSGPVPSSTSQGQNGIWGWDETTPARKVPFAVGRGGKSLTVVSAESPTPMKYVAGYSVYVPAQYDPSQPAALVVWNDGQPMMNPNGDIRAMNVVDNLIWRREMPVAITVFLDPARPEGTAQPDHRGDWGDSNTLRPWQYQWVDDNFAKLVCDELLPEISKRYNIDPNPDMHAIMGASSGGIAAFNVAWQRPNQFRRVISIVGSFTRIRGGMGDSFPELVAASEKKPIRVFMQDGRNDNRRPNNLPGDWFYQNVRLKDALVTKGYDVAWSWGIGNHGQKQGGAILPEMMRWLWRDHPVDPDPNNMIERAFRGPATRRGG